MPAERQLAAGELEQGIGPQRISVVLVSVATRQLEDPLAYQILQRVPRARRIFAPLGQTRSEGGADPQLLVGFDQPRQATIGGQHTSVKGGVERNVSTGGKAIDRCGSMGHVVSLGRS